MGISCPLLTSHNFSPTLTLDASAVFCFGGFRRLYTFERDLVVLLHKMTANVTRQDIPVIPSPANMSSKSVKTDVFHHDCQKMWKLFLQEYRPVLLLYFNKISLIEFKWCLKTFSVATININLDQESERSKLA